MGQFFRSIYRNTEIEMGAANFGCGPAMLSMQVAGMRRRGGIGGGGLDGDKMISALLIGLGLPLLVLAALFMIPVIDLNYGKRMPVESKIVSVIDREHHNKSRTSFSRSWYAKTELDPRTEIEVGSLVKTGDSLKYYRITGWFSGHVYRLEK